ncbi:ABC transporter ATP-binding protein [Moheibacter sediminis]|uniref:Iron complex transport system ATP-binding protein n=1 Tax=Moheibacter sediminis TaxID=1434700 RepID=A0A1W2AX92_9FLAO|nr:ABC transporter ATP-binding protein [Moheibacter sediminis]SMC65234.1 iron complex transport system ATP-binding protein [Moheibacter sediminis]
MNESILHIKNLSVGYSKPICEGINAIVNKGELVGLAGKNGSGKSTLIKSLLGLQPVFSGEIHLNQDEISNWNEAKRAREIAVVFSRLNQVPAISVEELVALGRLPYRNWLTKLDKSETEIINHSLELVGINHLRNRFANELSDGQLQMVMIARALVQDTNFIIMDEPTSHLDIENQFKIFELIYKLAKDTSKTFIVASHQIELLIQNATQLWWVNDGAFHAGFPEQIAYEQRIYEQLSQERIKFDYNKGRFQFQHLKLKKVKLITDVSDLAYWTKHALERNGFEISENGVEVKVEKGLIFYEGKGPYSLQEFFDLIKPLK